jgi:hypothetical protein
MNAPNATIHKLAVPKGTAPRKQRKASKAVLFRHHAPAIGLGAVIMVLLSLSLSHLARGVELVTGCAPWEALAMAIGIDLLIVALEVSMVTTVGTKAHNDVANGRCTFGLLHDLAPALHRPRCRSCRRLRVDGSD